MSGYRMFGNSSVVWLHLTFSTVYGSVLSIMDNFSKYLAFVTLPKLSKYDNFSIVCLPRWRRVGVTKYRVTSARALYTDWNPCSRFHLPKYSSHVHSARRVSGITFFRYSNSLRIGKSHLKKCLGVRKPESNNKRVKIRLRLHMKEGNTPFTKKYIIRLSFRVSITFMYKL